MDRPDSFDSIVRPLRLLAVLVALAAATACGWVDEPAPRTAEAPPHRPADDLLNDPALQRVEEARAGRDLRGLLLALEAPEPQLRARAAFGLGSLRAPEAAGALIEALDDPDPRVRADAAFALGQLPPETVTGDSTSVAPVAAGADRALFARLPNETDPAVRRALIEAIGRIGGDPVLRPLLTLPSVDPAERAAVNLAIARGLLRDRLGPEGWTRLVEDLGHPSAQVRAAAAYPFARSPEPGRWLAARGDLRDALRSRSYDDPTAWLLIRALGNALDTFSRPLIELWLANAVDWRARLAAIEAISGRKGTDGWALILGALDDPSIHVRIGAATSIATEPTPEPVIGLIVRLIERNAGDLAVNSILLEHLASQGITEPVEAWMDDHDWDDAERSQVAVAVAAATPAEIGVERLLIASVETDAPVRAAAFEQLVTRWELSREYPVTRPIFLEGFERILRGPDDGLAGRAAIVLADSLLIAEGSGALLRDWFAELAEEGRTDRAFAVLTALATDTTAATTALFAEVATSDDPLLARTARIALAEAAGDPPLAADSATDTGAPRSFATLDWARLRALGPAPRLVLETTRGEVVLRLAPLEAPLTVQEITRLAEEGHYDGTRFHRVLGNFVAQGGDLSTAPTPSGTAPRLRSELTRIPYREGVLGMARSAQLDTEGSQFFVTHSMQPHLTGLYGAFGWVIDGDEILDQIGPDDRLVSARVVRDPSGAGAAH